MKRKKSVIPQQDNGVFNLSISDLMAGLLSVFILALCIFILSFTQKTTVLTENNIRATINTNNEHVGKKIRDTEMMKIPFMCIIGGKEEENKMVTIREHGKDNNITLKIDEFIREII